MAVYSDKSLFEVLDLIYSAAAEPDHWRVLLERLSAMLGGSAGSLHSQNRDSQEASVGASWNIEPALIQQYVDYYSPINPCFTLGRSEIQQGGVKLRQAFCPDDIFSRSEFYNDYSRRLNAYHGVVATILEDETTSANLTIFRPKIGESFGEDECTFVRLLLPHMQRAFQLHNRIQGLESKGNAAADALDHLQQGVVLLDAKGRVLLVNRAAKAIFGPETALKITPGGLQAVLSSENR